MRPAYREEPCKTALNRCRGMPFRWTLNPYMGCVHRCTFCYVRAYEQRADRPSGDGYGASIRVKTNIAEVLRWELGRRSWRRETVAIGAATDPYQPAEGLYRLTRACISVLAAARNPFGVVTRGPLIVRDVDLLQEAARRADVSVSVSIPTLDKDVWRRTEPGTAPPQKRLRAVRALSAGGIRVHVAMAPVLPGISDRSEQLEEVVRAAREAGAAGVWASLLHLRPGTREHFLSCLARDWPELLCRYQRLYRFGPYLSEEAKAPVLRQVARLSAHYGLGERRRESQPPREAQLSLPGLLSGAPALAFLPA